MFENNIQLTVSEQEQIKYRNVPGFPGYRAGDDGSIWSCRKTGYGYGRTGKWKRLKPTVNHSNGRLMVGLAKDHRVHVKQLHRVIMLTFVGPCPKGLIVCHYDGNHLNNNLINLRYDTYTANEADKERHGRRLRGDRHPIAKLTKETASQAKRLLEKGFSLQVIADRLGVSKKTIVNIKKGRIWKWVDSFNST